MPRRSGEDCVDIDCLAKVAIEINFIVGVELTGVDQVIA